MTDIIHCKNFSKGIPCFSYIANKNHGNMIITIRNAAALVGMVLRIKKNNGKPINAAPPKHIVWRLVKPSRNFDFTTVKSLGIDT